MPTQFGVYRAARFIQQRPKCVCIFCSALVYRDETQCPECEQLHPQMGWPEVGSGMVDPLIGQQLEQEYLITKRIGKGSSGSVYRIISTTLPKTYAAKFVDISPESASAEQWIIRVQREIDTMTRTNNPHIVKLHNVYPYGPSGACLVMDFIEGETLQDYVPSRGMEVDVALRLTEQIALAIKSIHDIGVIHRDIKPENIMITEISKQEPFVTLLDFGLVSGDEAITKDFVGTPTFASPEICAGKTDVDERSDIYSIGCVLFFLMTGRLPFAARSTVEMLKQKTQQDAPRVSSILPHISPTIDAFVSMLLAREPISRPQTIRNVLSHLKMLLQTHRATQTNKLRSVDELIEGLHMVVLSVGEFNTRRLFDHLERIGDCTIAENASDLLIVARSQATDAVFLCIDEPGMHFLSVLKSLQRQGVPVIVGASSSMEDDAFDVLDLMGVPCFREPWNVSGLNEVIQSAIDLS